MARGIVVEALEVLDHFSKIYTHLLPLQIDWAVLVTELPADLRQPEERAVSITSPGVLGLGLAAGVDLSRGQLIVYPLASNVGSERTCAIEASPRTQRRDTWTMDKQSLFRVPVGVSVYDIANLYFQSVSSM